MSANAFRSQLMQQFAASARNQSRPPLALLGWVKEEDSSQQQQTQPINGMPIFQSTYDGHIHASNSSAMAFTGTSPRVEENSFLLGGNDRGTPSVATSPPPRLLPSIISLGNDISDSISHSQDDLPQGGKCELVDGKLVFPLLLQNMIRTRRANSRFAKQQQPIQWQQTRDSDGQLQEQESQFWQDALKRAVLCGTAAPHHKHTERCTFQRMVAPSKKIERLAEIAYHVSLSQQIAKSKIPPTKSSKNNHVDDSIQNTTQTMETMEALAEKKRDKWSRIPAFIVALVKAHGPEEGSDECVSTVGVHSLSFLSSTTSEIGPYDQLPYVPPATEADLEDYASASAAVQNILLSLHAESLASKWVTGPILRTPAFRELVDADKDDRVVGLIMVGRQHTPHFTPN